MPDTRRKSQRKKKSVSKVQDKKFPLTLHDSRLRSHNSSDTSMLLFFFLQYTV